MKTQHAASKSRGGFTLLEALLLVMVLGIAGASTGRSITNMLHSPEQNNNDLAIETALLDKMEFLHSLPFSSLAADVPHSNSAYTDLPTVQGTPMVRTVKIIYLVPTTGAQSFVATHIVQITVAVGGKSVVTMVNEP